MKTGKDQGEGMVVLDTSFIIDYLNEQEEAVKHFSKLTQRNEEMSTTIINIYELQVGLRKSSKKEKNQHIINELRKNVPVYSMDLGVIDIATRLSNTLAENGETINVFDIFIAAMCLSNGEKILTRNVKDFKKIKELEIETY